VGQSLGKEHEKGQLGGCGWDERRKKKKEGESRS